MTKLNEDTRPNQYLSIPYKTAEKGKHHILGGSGMHRWGVCHGSVREIRKAKESGLIPKVSPSSPAAQEGTIGHELGEHCLLKGLNPADFYGKMFQGVLMTAEYIDAVELYVNFVRKRLKYYSKKYGKNNVTLLIEASFDLTDEVGFDCGGSADAIIMVKDGLVEVIDYKHGKGTLVEIDNNPQVLFYMWCVWKNYNKEYNLSKGRITIVQPRMNHTDGPIRMKRASHNLIKQWGRDKLIPAVEAIKSDTAPLVPGIKQCQWCEVAAICKANSKKQIEVMTSDFEEFAEGESLPNPNTLTIEELEKIFLQKKSVEGWLKNVANHLSTRSKAGAKLKNTKLVRTYGHRKINDANKTIKRLTKRGVEKDKLYTERAILSPAKIEAHLKQVHRWSDAEIAKTLKGMIDIPTTGLALVSIDDRRQSIVPDISTDFVEHASKKPKKKKGKNRKAEKLINRKIDKLKKRV